ncbi:hypothetical protein NM688_g832 [Phlebia brevispora]|uniref:Uncharacterized protein n=1 Tax=Phlebia brevispora TaxID=194682 RepID=A0ACC1TDI0_9APHY|nr:hypothetical protein NM688_g832 [Phlebia brevispora]
MASAREELWALARARVEPSTLVAEARLSRLSSKATTILLDVGQGKAHAYGVTPAVQKPCAISARNICNACRTNVRQGGKLRTPSYSVVERSDSYIRQWSGVRRMSWIPKLGFGSKQQEPFNGPVDNEEEAARVAMLEKAMKGRQPTDLMLRCTILDEDGQFCCHLALEQRENNLRSIQEVGSMFRASIKLRGQPRDLRKIDSRIPNLVPTILVRREAILVNILHIRALVKADAVILFDTYGSTDSRLHSVFLYHLEHNLRAKNSGPPYEFRALESILLSVLSALEAEMVFIRNLVGNLLAELEDDIDRDKFKQLLYYSRRLASFQSRAKLVQEALEEVLEQDEDLSAMYLTDKKNGTSRVMNDHEELEVLLESFAKQVEEIVNEAESIQSNVQSTQEIVELILDSNRNALLALDLKARMMDPSLRTLCLTRQFLVQVSIWTMGIGVGTLVAGLFGMNLKSHLEEHEFAFFSMSLLSILVASIFSWTGLRRLARIRKFRLHLYLSVNWVHSLAESETISFLPVADHLNVAGLIEQDFNSVSMRRSAASKAVALSALLNTLSFETQEIRAGSGTNLCAYVRLVGAEYWVTMRHIAVTLSVGSHADCDMATTSRFRPLEAMPSFGSALSFESDILDLANSNTTTAALVEEAYFAVDSCTEYIPKPGRRSRTGISVSALLRALLDNAMKAAGHKYTTQPSRSSGEQSSGLDYIGGLVEPDTRNIQAFLRRWICARDNYQCCQHLNELDKSQKPRADTTTRIHLQAAHIVPFSLSYFNGQHSQDVRTAALNWTLIRNWGSIDVKKFVGGRINDPSNALLLCPNSHIQFAEYDIYFEATDAPHHYNIIETESDSKVGQIAFRDHSSQGIPLPSPDLLELHKAFARVLHASGAEEYLDEILRDEEEIAVLAADGSTDVAPLFYRLSLIAKTS